MRMLVSRAFVEYLHRFENVKVLLDLGCGDGGLLEAVRHLPALSASGVDLSPKAIEWAAQRRGVTAIMFDFVNKKEQIPAADCIVMCEVLEHLADPHGLLSYLAENKKAKYLVASSPANETKDRHYRFHLWAWDGEGYDCLFASNGWHTLRKIVIDGFQVVMARNVFFQEASQTLGNFSVATAGPLEGGGCGCSVTSSNTGRAARMMTTIPEAFALALGHHRAGRLQAAEEIYRRILAIDPQHADVLHLLGVLAHQSGQHEVAIEYIERAIALKGNEAVYHNNLGAVRRDQGDLDRAAACCERALQLKPDFAEAHNNLGNVWKDRGVPDKANACYHRALALNPSFAEPHNNLGNICKDRKKLDEAAVHYQLALQLKPELAIAYSNLGSVWREMGKADEAIACCHQALQLQPHLPEAQNNLANAFRDQGKLDEAASCCERALRLKPGYVEAHCNLGNIRKEQGRLEEAIACYERALQLNPEHAETHNNLGNVWQTQGKLTTAAACYRQALQLKPDFAEAHNNLGNALHGLGQLAESISCYRRALELRPDYAKAYNNLGNALKDAGEITEAITCYRQASQLRPDHLAAQAALVHYLQHACQWQGLEDLARRVISSVEHGQGGSSCASPFSFLALPIPTSAEQQLQCASQWAERELKAAREVGRGRAFDRAPRRESKITVGYLSADFCAHATAYLIAELDRRGFAQRDLRAFHQLDPRDVAFPSVPEPQGNHGPRRGDSVSPGRLRGDRGTQPGKGVVDDGRTYQAGGKVDLGCRAEGEGRPGEKQAVDRLACAVARRGKGQQRLKIATVIRHPVVSSSESSQGFCRQSNRSC